MYMYMHMYIHVYMYMYMHVYMYIHGGLCFYIFARTIYVYMNDQSLRLGKAKQLRLKTTPFFSRENEELQHVHVDLMVCVERVTSVLAPYRVIDKQDGVRLLWSLLKSPNLEVYVSPCM